MFVDYRDPEAIEQHGKTADFVLDASLFNAGEHAFIAKPSFYCRSRSTCFKILPDALRGKISMRS